MVVQHHTAVKEVKPPVAAKPEPVAPPPQAVVAPTVPSNDFYMDYIFTHESGKNPYSVNSIGCTGLGQACPGTKLTSVCPNLGDVACQTRFFTEYANGYGGWKASYDFWNCIGQCYSARIDRVVKKDATWW